MGFAFSFLEGWWRRSEAYKCSLPVYYSCKWVVQIQKCHLANRRGGKQEAKLRSSTYHSTHFCHMKPKIIYFTYFWDLSWQFRSFKVWIQKTFFSCIGILGAGFILTALFKYRAGNEIVKLLQTDIKTICFKHNQTMLLTMYNIQCSTVLLRMQSGDSPCTLYEMPRKYKPKFHHQQRLAFLLKHRSTSLRLIKDTAHHLQ